MNDPDTNRAPDLDPEQDERVRSLLADLGSGHETVPAEVAARLDDTLAGLVAEREAEHLSEEHRATGEVVPLRPRWMPRLAAGAAAVIVLGLGGVALVANLGDGSTEQTSSDAGAGSSLREDTASQAPLESAPSASDSAGGNAGDEATDEKGQLSRESLPQLRAATFDRDVQALLRRQPTLRPPARVQGQENGTAGSPSAAPSKDAPTPDALCPGPALTDGSTATVAVLDSTYAAIVVHPPAGGQRVVDAWSCDGTRRLASTTVAP